jgi:spore maturation protein CgeB
MTISEPVEFIDPVTESERTYALPAVCATMSLAEAAVKLHIHRTTAWRIEELAQLELEPEPNVTSYIESADVVRTHYYQPLSSAELEALDSAASPNFHAGIGERL